MNSQEATGHSDVIIVGASFAGIECAKTLGNSELSVMVIERDKEVGRKPCAGGVTPSDLEYIPEQFLNFGFQKIQLWYRDKVVLIPEDGGIISTVERKALLQHQLESLQGFNNVRTLTGVTVLDIASDNSLILSSGRKLSFKFLVGADGAASIVRRYLGLPTEKLELALQYIVPQRLENFEIHLDERLFGTGYLWVFPHKGNTSIGCGSDIRFAKAKWLRGNLDRWLKKRGVDSSGVKFEAASINYDYRGYKFGNIFLAGEAAGLTSGLTGKGMYSASLSGRQIALDVLRRRSLPNLIETWLRTKRKQECYTPFLKTPFLRKMAFSAGVRLVPHKQIQKRVIALVEP